MRYYIKGKIKPEKMQSLTESIKSASIARGKVFYEGMVAALRDASIDLNDNVHFIEVCYCLEAGLYPMAMELPVLEKYFESIEVKDARLRDQCTMECEFCDCTRNIKLPGKPLVSDKLETITKEHNDCDEPDCDSDDDRYNDFIDIGRIKLNRKKQRIGLDELKKVLLSESKVISNNNNDGNGGNCGDDGSNDMKTTSSHSATISIKYNNAAKKFKPIFAGAAISGLFVIFYDGVEYFRVKNIPDNSESRSILEEAGIKNIYGNVPSMKAEASLNSIAKSSSRSNVV